MFNKIMVPVDLAHLGALEKALTVSGRSLAPLRGGPVLRRRDHIPAQRGGPHAPGI